jgi:hypothetical protein
MGRVHNFLQGNAEGVDKDKHWARVSITTQIPNGGHKKLTQAF